MPNKDRCPAAIMAFLQGHRILKKERAQMGTNIILLYYYSMKKICKIKQGGIIRGEEKMDANKLAPSNQELDIIYLLKNFI